jgi:Co/Zn/Cd efflux system component
MGDDCCADCGSQTTPFRAVLWTALAINAAMFVVEVGLGVAAGSSALQADALDFLGDAANYAMSLAVVGLALSWRARAAILKGSTMAVFGFWVIANAIWHSVIGTVPFPVTMSVVSVIAMIANGVVALMLFRFRSGEANMRSVWLCARNDVIGNIAVLLAAFGVFGTGERWPDTVVALIMAGLALTSAWNVNRQAFGELRAAHG